MIKTVLLHETEDPASELGWCVISVAGSAPRTLLSIVNDSLYLLYNFGYYQHRQISSVSISRLEIKLEDTHRDGPEDPYHDLVPVLRDLTQMCEGVLLVVDELHTFPQTSERGLVVAVQQISKLAALPMAFWGRAT